MSCYPSFSIMWIIYAIGGALIIGVICYFIGRSTKVHIAEKEVDQALQDKETALKNSIIELQDKKASTEEEFHNRSELLQADLTKAEQSYAIKCQERELEVQRLDTKRVELLRSIDDMKAAYKQISEDSQAAAKDIEIMALQRAAENIEQRSKELEAEYAEHEKKYHADMLVMMQEAVTHYQQITLTAQEESDHAIETLNDLRARIDSIVETNKRAAQEENQRDFYRLQLSNEDIAEIAKIRSIEPYLRSSEPLNKVIWKVYYEKAYNDLIGRVIGPVKRMGIYKITNLENGMCYVGQRVDVAERWKQHIKRGIGADTPTRNKLYPAMLKTGVENFTFELLEECTTSTKLNEREDYWQQVYHAIDFGYSIK